LKASNKTILKVVAGLPISFVALGIILAIILITIILWFPLLQWV